MDSEDVRGIKTAFKLKDARQTAAEAGKKVAEANQRELAIHRPNGQICDKDSCGNDPIPHKDRNIEGLQNSHVTTWPGGRQVDGSGTLGALAKDRHRRDQASAEAGTNA
jgi:hypothetical protein